MHLELHCHLLGVISPELLERVRADGHTILVEPRTLAAIYPVRGVDGFRRFVEVLRPYHSAPPEVMRAILDAHVRSLREQGVVYTELMISPAMFPPGTEQLLEAFDRWRHTYNHVRPHEALDLDTPADRYRVSQRAFPETIPEVEASLVQPELWLGRPENPVGRWIVQMAAGTNGGAAIYRTYYEHGIDTILAMHIDDAELRKLEHEQPARANLVITGHMPSDSIGMNRLIRAMEQRGLEVIAGSGVIRV